MNNFTKSFHKQPPEHQQLTKQEQATAKNLKTGLAIFLILASIGLVLDIITK